MPLTIDTSLCYADRIGGAGAVRAAVETWQAKAPAALDAIRAARDDGSLPLFRLAHRDDDLDQARELAQAWRRRYDRVVIYGIGGSALGARALLALRDPADDDPVILVPDNLDPQVMSQVLADRRLADTGFVVVSKSGGTAETLTQALVTLDALAAQGLNPEPRIACVVEPGDSVLRKLGTEIGATMLDHDPLVGGRFSVLSVVGMLPALLAGLDPSKIRAGAAAVQDAALGTDGASSAPAEGAALACALAEAGVRQSVLMPYVDRLHLLAVWYRQIWAESLGKQGHGTTPIDALGPVDQHSQLQLYLEGPADKLFSLIEAPIAGTGPQVPADKAQALGLDYLAGRTVGDLVAAECRATVETLAGNGRPVRRLNLEKVDEEALGALFMHFMLETAISAGLLGIDAYDQPAVEQGKVLARKYLAEMS
ncbi:MAG: glucose-6-phosphate isomerase [Alphaproteobacteria bacterium]